MKADVEVDNCLDIDIGDMLRITTIRVEHKRLQ